MNRITIMILSLLTIFAMRSAEASSSVANINDGDLLLSGGFGMGYDSEKLTTYGILPRAELFVFDHISVGAMAYYSGPSDQIRAEYGPTMTVHVPIMQKLVINAGAGAMIKGRDTQREDSYAATASRLTSVNGKAIIGANYFATPTLAFGPVMLIDVPFSRDDSEPRGRSSVEVENIMFALSFYL